eukprot:14240567-Alexandrium_andersonii.AAC.1
MALLMPLDAGPRRSSIEAVFIGVGFNCSPMRARTRDAHDDTVRAHATSEAAFGAAEAKAVSST